MPPSTLSSRAMIGAESRARKRTRERRDATAANAGEAFPRLLNDIVVTHILKSAYFDDPADLARLPAVSRAMRDTVSGAGLRFEELVEHEFLKLGCLSALKRLHRGGILSRQELLCHAAARGGHLQQLQELRENGCPWNEYTSACAAKGGHLEVIQWARANGCPWDSNTCAYAANGGHPEVLQWARVNGCPWDEETCWAAAMGGHLEMLQWLRANGCPWDVHTCSLAANGGQLELLQWARANGCMWDYETFRVAASGKHLEMVQWLRANGCPQPLD